MKGVILALIGLSISIAAVLISHTSVILACLIGAVGVLIAAAGWFVKN